MQSWQKIVILFCVLYCMPVAPGIAESSFLDEVIDWVRAQGGVPLKDLEDKLGVMWKENMSYGDAIWFVTGEDRYRETRTQRYSQEVFRHLQEKIRDRDTEFEKREQYTEDKEKHLQMELRELETLKESLRERSSVMEYRDSKGLISKDSQLTHELARAKQAEIHFWKQVRRSQLEHFLRDKHHFADIPSKLWASQQMWQLAPETAEKMLLEVLEQGSDDEQRQAATMLLEHSPNPRALRFWQEQLKSPQEQKRWDAAEILLKHRKERILTPFVLSQLYSPKIEDQRRGLQLLEKFSPDSVQLKFIFAKYGLVPQKLSELEDYDTSHLRNVMETQNVSWDFSDYPLFEVVTVIRYQHKINIVVSPSLLQNWELEGIRATLQLKNIPLRQAIDLLCTMYQFEYQARQGVLWLTRPTVVRTARIHPIGDLIPAQFVGQEFLVEDYISRLLNVYHPDFYFSLLGDSIVLRLSDQEYRELLQYLALVRSVGSKLQTKDVLIGNLLKAEPEVKSNQELKLLANLEEKVKLDFTEAPLCDVLRYLFSNKHIANVMSPNIFKALNQADVNLVADDITVSAALKIVLSSHNLSYVVHNGIVIVTSKPEEVLALSSAQTSSGVEGDSPRQREIKERLMENTISIDFVESPLGEVLDFLRNKERINILIDPSVYRKLPEEDQLKVNIQGEDLSLLSMLQATLFSLGLTYELRDGVVFITTPIESEWMVRDIDPILSVADKIVETIGTKVDKKDVFVNIENRLLVARGSRSVLMKIDEILQDFVAKTGEKR